jgi:hypothetical protein
VIRKGDNVKYGPETVVRNDDGSTVVRATPILNYIPDKRLTSLGSRPWSTPLADRDGEKGQPVVRA